MAQIILLYPNTGNTGSREQMLPLGLLYVAAPLAANDYSIRIIDQNEVENWESELEASLKEEDALCVGISSMTGHQIKAGIVMAKTIRRLSPNIPIIWGGVHPSLLPEQTVDSEWVDAVVVGEGEDTFLELIRAFEDGGPLSEVRGICYKQGGRIIRTGLRPPLDLDKIDPLPYHLLNIKVYLKSPLRSEGLSLPIITSRGCPSMCSYCYNLEFNHRLWKPMSPQKVVNEIRHLVNHFGANGVFLLDDNFFVSIKRVKEILHLLEAEKISVTINNANCRIDYLVRCDNTFLDMLRKGGVKQLFLGVESGSDDVLGRIKKQINVEQVILVNQRLKDADIVPVYSFMAGFPFEGVEEVKQTLDLMARLVDENPQAKLYKLSLYTPFPGTELFKLCLEEGMPFPESMVEWAEFNYNRVNINIVDNRKLKFLKKAERLSGFIDVKKKLQKKSPVLELLLAFYSWLIRLRCKEKLFLFMPELHLVKRMRKLQKPP